VLSADDPGLRETHELTGVELHGARWAGLDVSGLRFDETLLVRCDLSGASLANAELTDAVLDEPNLANAVIRGGSLTRVLVSGGRLTGAQWAETRIHDTVWRNAAADLSAFRLCELVRVTFDSCNLREADFSGAQFSGSIQGTVQDPAGAVVPNAKVQLKNTATSVAVATTSDVDRMPITEKIAALCARCCVPPMWSGFPSERRAHGKCCCSRCDIRPCSYCLCCRFLVRETRRKWRRLRRWWRLQW
jgi:uncharacterized protein YjbI with pentapeptide repeats